MITSSATKAVRFLPQSPPPPGPPRSDPYHEYKYLIFPDQLALCRRMLDGLYRDSDPYPEGELETTYYDTLGLQCFDVCQSGDPWKCKFRVRHYPDTGLTQAQVKAKSLSQVAKWKAPLAGNPAPDVQWHHLQTARPDDGLPLRGLGARFGCLLPVMRVDYRRIRYRGLGCRINIDEHVRFERRSSIVGGPHHRHTLPFAILEIKTTSERPFLPFLGVLQPRPVSFSKYRAGLDMLANGPDVLRTYL